MEIYIIDYGLGKVSLVTTVLSLLIASFLGSDITWGIVILTLILTTILMAVVRARRGALKYKFVFNDKVITNDEDYNFEGE